MNVSGRTDHKRKVTVYMSEEELHALDATVLEMRRRTGMRIDRGRFIREALAASSFHKIAGRIREGVR